jgi:hypothetical protein
LLAGFQSLEALLELCVRVFRIAELVFGKFFMCEIGPESTLDAGLGCGDQNGTFPGNNAVDLLNFADG